MIGRVRKRRLEGNRLWGWNCCRCEQAIVLLFRFFLHRLVRLIQIGRLRKRLKGRALRVCNCCRCDEAFAVLFLSFLRRILRLIPFPSYLFLCLFIYRYVNEAATALPIISLRYAAGQRDARRVLTPMMSSAELSSSSLPMSSTPTPAIMASVATSTRTGPGT